MVNYQEGFTAEDTEMYELLELLRSFSACKDKQVAAISTDPMGRIIGVGYNTPTAHCDKCEATTHPKACAVHAEQSIPLCKDGLIYLTTFPCKDCQMVLWAAGIKKVYVFGKQHKEDIGLLDITLIPDVADMLLKFNGSEKQKAVIMGELAELITAIADSLRKDPKDNRNIEEELIDVELQLHCLRRVLGPAYMLKAKTSKYDKLVEKFYYARSEEPLV